MEGVAGTPAGVHAAANITDTRNRSNESLVANIRLGEGARMLTVTPRVCDSYRLLPDDPFDNRKAAHQIIAISDQRREDPQRMLAGR